MGGKEWKSFLGSLHGNAVGESVLRIRDQERLRLVTHWRGSRSRQSSSEPDSCLQSERPVLPTGACMAVGKYRELCSGLRTQQWFILGT